MLLALTIGAGAQLQPRLDGDSSQAVGVGGPGRSGRPVRLWDRGPLTWGDFKVLPSDSVHTSWMECMFRLDSTDNIGGMKMCRTKVVCEMDPSASWVMDDYMTDQELAYNQVLFNLAEIQCRMFQPSLDLNQSPLEGDSLLMCVAGYYGVEEERFVWESGGGQNGDVVTRWLDSTIRVLAEMPAQSQVRVVPTNELVIGAHMGVAYTSLGRGLNFTYRNPVSFEFGFEFGKGRHSFIWDILIGGAGSKESFTLQDYTFPVGKTYTWMQMGFDYGFYAVRQPRYNVMPFVGLGLSSIMASVGPDEDDPSFGDACGSWMAGVAVDWAFHNRVSCPFNDGTREQEESDVRLMLYASRSALYGYKCVSLNAAVVLNFGLRYVKTKYPTIK